MAALTGISPIDFLISISLLPFILLIMTADHCIKYKNIQLWHDFTEAKVMTVRLHTSWAGRYIRKEEYPTLKYEVNGIPYWEEYRWGSRKPGLYHSTDIVKIRYNCANPRIFVVENDNSYSSLKQAFVYPVTALILFLLFGGPFFYNLHTSSPVNPKNPEAWIQLANTYHSYEDNFSQITADQLLSDTKEAADHYLGLKSRIRRLRSDTRRTDSLQKLEDTVNQAKFELFASYTDFVGDFFESSGVPIDRSHLADSLQKQITPLLTPDLPSSAVSSDDFTLDDLLIALTLACELDTPFSLSGWPAETDRVFQCEESLGLDLAVIQIKLELLADSGRLSPAMSDYVRSLFPGYIPKFLEQVDQAVAGNYNAYQDGDYLPLEYEAVYTTYQAAMDLYRENGQTEPAVYQANLLAKQIFDQKQSMDKYRNVIRYDYGLYLSFLDPDNPDDLNSSAYYQRSLEQFKDSLSTKEAKDISFNSLGN